MALYLSLGADAAVGLTAYPSLRLLLGHFNQVTVEARNIELGGLVVNEYLVVAENVSVNMRDLLARRELRLREQGQLEVRMAVAAGELSNYLWEMIPELDGWRIQIYQDYVIVLGRVPLLNTVADLTVRGRFAPLGRDKIAFLPERVELMGVALPEALVAAALHEAQFYIDLGASPMPLELIDVKMEPGRLIINARVLQ